jgi:hypothetical protein
MPPPSSRDGDLFDRATYFGEVGGAGRPRRSYEDFLRTYGLPDTLEVRRAHKDATSDADAVAAARRAAARTRRPANVPPPTDGVAAPPTATTTYDDRHDDDGLLD